MTRRNRYRRSQCGFNPTDVTAVRNGYWWTASGVVGLGTTGFRVVEQNGHSTFDQIQATITAQPTLLTENGGRQFRMRKSVDAAPSIITTSGAVQAGWTGDTYVAGWFRLPDASGDITGVSNLFVHTPTAAGQRRFSMVATQPTDRISTVTSNDGTTTATNTWANPFTGGWLWLEHILLVGVSIELVSNGVQLAHTATATPGTPLFDGNTAAFIGCRAAAGLANVDTTDWATVFYANGIPTESERRLLAGVNNPAAVTW